VAGWVELADVLCAVVRVACLVADAAAVVRFFAVAGFLFVVLVLASAVVAMWWRAPSSQDGS
jgi:hypothetical protein